MPGIELDLVELLLDLQNPRISKADTQREALQKIIEDQDLKLVILAESIVADGLSPMDRWLVLKSPDERGKYIVLEGNRRLATIRLLYNSAVLNDLEVRSPIKRRLEELSAQFNLKSCTHSTLATESVPSLYIAEAVSIECHSTQRVLIRSFSLPRRLRHSRSKPITRRLRAASNCFRTFVPRI